MNQNAPSARNVACPCGSGRRYKHCHGMIAAPPVDDPVLQARAQLDNAAKPDSARVRQQILDRFPEHPGVLGLLAQSEYEHGNPVGALKLSLRAVRALAQTPLPPAESFGVWTTLNFMFTQALAGLGTTVATAKRDAYFRRLDTPAASVAMNDTDVSIILALPSGMSADAWGPTLDSLGEQSQLPAELIVVAYGPKAASPALHSRVAALPFDARFVDGAPPADFATALDAGIAASRGHWLLAIEPPHAIAPDHLQSLVESLRAHSCEWGFSACHWEAIGDDDSGSIAARTADGTTLQQSIIEADTVGFALINKAFVAIGAGAVMFSRSLYERVGGFRNLPGHAMWDFAMRALWLSEPWFTAAPTYAHRIAASVPAQDQSAAGVVQVRMFHDYYGLAGDESRVPPNPFAPSLARWGLHTLKRVFQTGHVLAFDLAAIESLAGRVFAAIESRQTTLLTPGINLVGFAYGEFGLGESLRALARAADAGAIPFIVKDVDQRLLARQADRSIANHVSEMLQHQLTLLCLNPDMLKPALPILQRTRDGGGRNVGYWYWELEHTPRAWDAAFEAVDELWCATEFIATAMRRASGKPVFKIPPPIELEIGRAYSRSEFSLPSAPYLFLFTFDFNSFVMRKNSEAVIHAFRSAFPPGRDDVGLVVKSINGANRPELVASVRASIAGDQRIVQIDRFLSRDETYGLISVCDAYVSLHRAEGFGLGLAEAMFLGKPVVGTGYSGNLEFMNEANSALVDYRMVAVKPGEYLYDDPRFVWAEADVDDAARHLRRLADDAGWRSHLAAAGQQHIRTNFTRERAASDMRARLAELGMSMPPPASRSSVFISYAQNGEDALLSRVLDDVEHGFYIDVGASEPDTHSVTRAFYERGWSGINIEPLSAPHARLAAERARDVNLAVAAGPADGTIVIGEIADTGLSTANPEIAARHARNGYPVVSREVPMLTLDTIWAQNVAGDVHFLKIDVEGCETEVLAGVDLATRRPWIVVVEATAPLTWNPTYADWEPKLLGARYLFAHDDGLNRYYVADERAALIPRFSRAATVPVKRAVELVADDPTLTPEQRFDPSASLYLDASLPAPTLAKPVSQLCTQSQFNEPEYLRWCRALREIPGLRRKQWEFVYAIQVLESAGMLQPGRRGLGFGCGREPLEPLVALLAARGCEVVATDQHATMVAGHGWIETDQHSASPVDLNDRGICPPELFARNVNFQAIDMNDISPDLVGFDFVWSCCSFEHLGSIEKGLEFVRRAMHCLRPGGIAVHTTEFNLTSNLRTIESTDRSIFRRQDLERLVRRLEEDGHRVRPFNFNPGTGPVDRYVDLPPYRHEPQLKLRLDRFVFTSIGLAVECGG